uniref:Uncharacterized protein n=1 Tax=Tanacetum cinerariifolium TaxID=118510 RepID=A0A6L2N3C6_TANCI|nr:hypothetical protein [Tanacetum cinerariifolium]
MLESKAYKEYYAIASGVEPPKEKTKYKKKADEPITPSKSKSFPAAKGTRLKTPAKAEQINLATKRSKKDFHMSHASGSGDGIDVQSKVPDEQQQKVTGTNKGAGVRPEVPDVPKYTSESEEESWTFSQDDEDDVEESYMNDGSEENRSDNDRDDLTHPNLSTYKADNDEVSSYQRVYTPLDYQQTDEEENQEGDDEVKEGEEEQGEEEELYEDLNINCKESQSFVNAQVFVAAETPYSDTTNPQTHISIMQPLQQTPESTTTTTIPTMTLPDIPNFASLFQFDQRVHSTMKIIIKEHVHAQVSKIIPKIKKYVTESLRDKVLVRSTNQPQTSYAVAASLLEFELKKILIDKIEENQSVNRPDIQKNLYIVLVESYNFDKDIFSTYGDVVTLKRVRDDQDKDEDPSSRSNRGSKRRRSGKEAESSKEPTHKESKSTSSSQSASRSQPKSSGKSAQAEEHGQIVDNLEE